jgi:hypothetical protein
MKHGKRSSSQKHTERLTEKPLNPFLHQGHNRDSEAYRVGLPAPHGGHRARDGFSKSR